MTKLTTELAVEIHRLDQQRSAFVRELAERALQYEALSGVLWDALRLLRNAVTDRERLSVIADERGEKSEAFLFAALMENLPEIQKAWEVVSYFRPEILAIEERRRVEGRDLYDATFGAQLSELEFIPDNNQRQAAIKAKQPDLEQARDTAASVAAAFEQHAEATGDTGAQAIGETWRDREVRARALLEEARPRHERQRHFWVGADNPYYASAREDLRSAVRQLAAVTPIQLWPEFVRDMLNILELSTREVEVDGEPVDFAKVLTAVQSILDGMLIHLPQ